MTFLVVLKSTKSSHVKRKDDHMDVIAAISPPKDHNKKRSSYSQLYRKLKYSSSNIDKVVKRLNLWLCYLFWWFAAYHQTPITLTLFSFFTSSLWSDLSM